jgi:hypothetical protein
MPALFPPETPIAFYNQRWVQQALGVPVNFTLSANAVTLNFFGITGDPMRRSVAEVEYLLSTGVRLAMVFGDRDYRCNCKLVISQVKLVIFSVTLVGGILTALFRDGCRESESGIEAHRFSIFPYGWLRLYRHE